ncbi:methyltransferase, partial [Patescibacteria group bacterium]|nr:methyltransferase [Patescibacteria group bacterium]
RSGATLSAFCSRSARDHAKMPPRVCLEAQRLASYQLPATRHKIQVLDMFAGSGCVGIAVLTRVPSAHVDFAEKGKNELRQIRRNLKENNIAPGRFRVLSSNIFSAVKGKYDFILANPPYAGEEYPEKVEESVRKWEPRRAVFAGKEGMEVIRPFLEQATCFLKPGGVLYMELDPSQKDAVARILKKRYPRHRFFKDQFKRWRFCRFSG